MYEEDGHRREVEAELARRGLVRSMHEDRWQALVHVIGTLPFPPPYQRKDVLHARPQPGDFESDVWYHGDWIDGIHPYFSTEWIRIRPRYLKHVAMRLPDVVVDCEGELESALRSIGQGFEKAGDSIFVHACR